MANSRSIWSQECQSNLLLCPHAEPRVDGWDTRSKLQLHARRLSPSFCLKLRYHSKCKICKDAHYKFVKTHEFVKTHMNPWQFWLCWKFQLLLLVLHFRLWVSRPISFRMIKCMYVCIIWNLPSSSAIPTFKFKGLWSSKWFRVWLVWFGLYRMREEIVETCGDPAAETSHLCLENWSALGFTVQHFPRPPDYKNVHHDFLSYCTSYCVCCIARLGFLPSYSFLFLPYFPT